MPRKRRRLEERLKMREELYEEMKAENKSARRNLTVASMLALIAIISAAILAYRLIFS